MNTVVSNLRAQHRKRRHQSSQGQEEHRLPQSGVPERGSDRQTGRHRRQEPHSQARPQGNTGMTDEQECLGEQPRRQARGMWPAVLLSGSGGSHCVLRSWNGVYGGGFNARSVGFSATFPSAKFCGPAARSTGYKPSQSANDDHCGVGKQPRPLQQTWVRLLF
jgi:hypothetical protein